MLWRIQAAAMRLLFQASSQMRAGVGLTWSNDVRVALLLIGACRTHSLSQGARAGCHCSTEPDPNQRAAAQANLSVLAAREVTIQAFLPDLPMPKPYITKPS